MNVKNFIEFLKQFPDDTEVEVIKTSSGRNWQGESHTWETFQGEEYKDYDLFNYKKPYSLRIGREE